MVQKMLFFGNRVQAVHHTLQLRYTCADTSPPFSLGTQVVTCGTSSAPAQVHRWVQAVHPSSSWCAQEVHHPLPLRYSNGYRQYTITSSSGTQIGTGRTSSPLSQVHLRVQAVQYSLQPRMAKGSTSSPPSQVHTKRNIEWSCREKMSLFSGPCISDERWKVSARSHPSFLTPNDA